MSGFSLSSEPFTLERDCQAVMVPQGETVTLPAGQIGYITQALGGSFTVYIEGNLFRIAGDNADAIGKEAVKAPELPPNSTEEDVKDKVQRIPTVTAVSVELTFDPPWNQSMMSEAARLQTGMF